MKIGKPKSSLDKKKPQTIEEEFVETIDTFNKSVIYLFVEVLVIGLIILAGAYLFGFIKL